MDIPPWEAALVSSATSNKEKKRQEAARKQKEADEARKVCIRFMVFMFERCSVAYDFFVFAFEQFADSDVEI